MFRFLRLMKASRRFGQASRRMRREDFAGARDLFVAALDLVGTDSPRGITVGVWFSVRFQSLRFLAQCAAKLNEVALARSCIDDAKALWEAENIGPAASFAGLPEWMKWADAYLNWSAKPESSQ